MTYQGTSLFQDPDVIEISSSGAWDSSQTNRKIKRAKVVPCEVIEIKEDDNSDAAIFITESNLCDKKKQPIAQNESVQLPNQGNSLLDLSGPSTWYYSYGDNFIFDIPNFSYLPLGNNYPSSSNNYASSYADMTHGSSSYGLTPMSGHFNINPNVILPKATVPQLQTPAPTKVIEDTQTIIVEDEIDTKVKSFKKFDAVKDHSDHHYASYLKGSASVSKTSKTWAKKIQNDWKLLEQDLPDKIFVRVYEDRMDLLRAVIVGPGGTPYHDGLFFFDVFFPCHYPQSPPLVYYHSGGLRLNPNLYACGKVCLSLLNTWDGSGCERWNRSKSTILQVLLSIQALVLNAKPYFNEPGFASSVNTPTGEAHSLAYNEQAFILSCKTMLYTLRRPPKNFEDFVFGHFRQRGHAILVACRAYMDGAQVGCLVENGVQDVDEGDKSSSETFRTSLRQVYDDLHKQLTTKGSGGKVILDTTLNL